jgi:hypothetical protein
MGQLPGDRASRCQAAVDADLAHACCVHRPPPEVMRARAVDLGLEPISDRGHAGRLSSDGLSRRAVVGATPLDSIEPQMTWSEGGPPGIRTLNLRIKRVPVIRRGGGGKGRDVGGNLGLLRSDAVRLERLGVQRGLSADRPNVVTAASRTLSRRIRTSRKGRKRTPVRAIARRWTAAIRAGRAVNARWRLRDVLPRPAPGVAASDAQALIIRVWRSELCRRELVNPGHHPSDG